MLFYLFFVYLLFFSIILCLYLHIELLKYFFRFVNNMSFILNSQYYFSLPCIFLIYLVDIEIYILNMNTFLCKLFLNLIDLYFFVYTC